jgi:RNA polymerase sigma-70 factor (ECF subfamily)
LSVSTYNECTDCELLRGIRQNDEGAFAEFFKRYWVKVHAMTYARVRSDEVTKEIVQELFISLWDKRSTLLINHPTSYLYTAVKNKVLNYIESQIVRRKHWDHYKQFIPLHDIVTENDVESNELMGAIENGIEQLPEKSKRVFRLSLLEGRSVKEIANTLNLSEKAIQYHLTQSIKKLRVRLKNFTLLICFFVLY